MRRRAAGRHLAPSPSVREHVPLLATIGLLAVLGAMAFGPVKSYAAAADRVDQLEQGQAELQSEVDRLEERRERLQNPDEIELLARERFGLVRPGEIPYIVVTADPELGELLPVSGEPVNAPWYRRLGEALRRALGWTARGAADGGRGSD